jgi:hypothetical protein
MVFWWETAALRNRKPYFATWLLISLCNAVFLKFLNPLAFMYDVVIAGIAR